jgi:CO/xanthine dehydrogenase Mo-binding subunit
MGTMADYRLIGTSQTPKDLMAKITGRARYAEDFRVDGMLFTKLLLSPVPRGRVRSLDLSRARAIPGCTRSSPPTTSRRSRGKHGAGPDERDPLPGQPIAAVAAVDETTAAEAVAAIRVDIERLPFVIDPLDSLRPGGPNARDEGNATTAPTARGQVSTASISADRRATAFPEGDFEGLDGWEIGDLEAAFARSDLIVEEPIVHQSQTHHPLEPRSAMAYWQNGKCYLHCSTQSAARTARGHASRLGLEEEDLVLISEFCGGGSGARSAVRSPT